ncbi:hypothetical protein IT6_09805 [Methylacidiphilum caldifontis]|uniref:hypothetical protein n=1 Tax=Methylacidiphilum caldifontis TaxID=2795386 RepID=UPI001A8C1819|nr:hypothetical protein [Methylacidiphilum caldifontis]QSR88639.1 hypothetical protein IT6_09805 [Methylacidiphilum caldifontis]
MKAWEYFLARLAATAVTQNIKRAEDHNDHHTRAIVELICKTVLDSTRHDPIAAERDEQIFNAGALRAASLFAEKLGLEISHQLKAESDNLLSQAGCK